MLFGYNTTKHQSIGQHSAAVLFSCFSTGNFSFIYIIVSRIVHSGLSINSVEFSGLHSVSLFLVSQLAVASCHRCSCCAGSPFTFDADMVCGGTFYSCGLPFVIWISFRFLVLFASYGS